MFSHLSTTLEGLFSIRLYYCEELFDTFNQGLIDADNKALHALMAGITGYNIFNRISLK